MKRAGRPRQRPASTSNINGQIIYKNTNQKVYYSTHMCQVARHTLENSDPYNAGTAIALMDKSYRKRVSHGDCYLVDTEFIVEQSKHSKDPLFRNALTYREIVDIHRSRTRPEFFVLGINTLKGRRYYEVYKCKTAVQVSEFERFVRKARMNPNFSLRDEPAIGTRVFHPQERPRSLSILDVGSPPSPIPEPLPIQPIYKAPVLRANPPPAVVRGSAGITFLEHKPDEGGITETPYGPMYVFSSDTPNAPLDLHSRHSTPNLSYIG